VSAARPDLLRAASSSLMNVGHAQIRTGDMGAAVARFEEAVAIRKDLLAADPRDVLAQDELDDARATLGGLRAVTGDLGGAVAMHRETLESPDLASEHRSGAIRCRQPPRCWRW
jgi:hypothetical protein